MSQPAPKQEKTRSRVRAASLTGVPTGNNTALTDNNQDQAVVQPKQTKQKDKSATKTEKNHTIEDVLIRLNSLEDISTALKALQNKYDTDSAKHDQDLVQITNLLEDSRKERLDERREHLITKRKLENTMETNKRMTSQMNDLENKIRSCNLKIDGKAEEEGEDLRKFVVEMAASIGVTTLSPNDLLTIHRMGKRTDTQSARHRPRPILLSFVNIQKRNKFFFARANLKDMNSYRGIYINDDVTITTRKQRDDYRSVAALARSKGMEVRVHTDGLVLDGKKYQLNEPHTLPVDCSLAKAKVIEVNDEIYFASEHAYLSNFYPSPIVIDDKAYDTAEHLYQALKCEHALDSDRLGKVMTATTPLEAKRLADAIPESPEWRARKEEAMARVIDLKFNQNRKLGELLLATGDAPLNEATYNDFFGIGVALHGREIRDKSYRGSNKLGLILMAKRANIRTTDQFN